MHACMHTQTYSFIHIYQSINMNTSAPRNLPLAIFNFNIFVIYKYD